MHWINILWRELRYSIVLRLRASEGSGCYGTLWHARRDPRNDKVRNNNVTRVTISSIIINIRFLCSLFLRCSIKPHKYFPMSRECFGACHKNHLFSRGRKKSIFIYLEKSEKSNGKSFECKRKWLFEMWGIEERRGKKRNHENIMKSMSPF